MCRNFEPVIDSRSARLILGYCDAVTKELGLTRDVAFWGLDGPPKEPFLLSINITFPRTVARMSPYTVVRTFSYTEETIGRYETGATKAAIEREIRDDLERLKQEHGARALTSAPWGPGGPLGW